MASFGNMFPSSGSVTIKHNFLFFIYILIIFWVVISTWLHLRIDGVIWYGSIQRMCFCLSDDLLCVIQHESSKDDKPTICNHRLQTYSHHRACWQEQCTWKYTQSYNLFLKLNKVTRSLHSHMTATVKG